MYIENQQRESFTDNYLAKVAPIRVKIRRPCIFEDTLGLYEANANIIHQFPINVEFMGEKALDGGGVGREFFSAFWEEAYLAMFDGASLVTPAVHAHVNLATFKTLGKIISHGYLSSAFLPVRIAFPTLAVVLLGPSQKIPSSILKESFMDYLSAVDRVIVRKALAAQDTSFSEDLSSKLVAVLSRFGCREVPLPTSLLQILLSVAKHEFVSRPFEAVTHMNGGIPSSHRAFWSQKSIKDLYSLYTALSANPQKVLDHIVEPLVFQNPSEERIFGYLLQFVGNMKNEEVQTFLRFVTGSSACLATKIGISFNGLSGAARRPIAHTCACELELSVTYTSYCDFVREFTTVLNEDQYCWEMHGL